MTCMIDTLALKMSVGSNSYQFCFPIMVAPGLPSLGQTPTPENVGELMIRACMRLVKAPYDILDDSGETLAYVVKLHKAETATVEGYEWWSAACTSDREANPLTNKGKNKLKAYACLSLFFRGAPLRPRARGHSRASSSMSRPPVCWAALSLL